MQHQDQLQSRRFSNEEIVVESLGCHVKRLGGGTGETHSWGLCNNLCAVQSLNMTTNYRSIKRNGLFWLCWPSWSPLEPCLSGKPWHVTGPPVSRRLSSCKRWWLSPASLHSCWTTTWAVKETHACSSCWTGVSNKVKEPRDQKKMLHCNWHVKGECLCIKHRMDWHILHTLKVFDAALPYKKILNLGSICVVLILYIYI